MISFARFLENYSCEVLNRLICLLFSKFKVCEDSHISVGQISATQTASVLFFKDFLSDLKKTSCSICSLSFLGASVRLLAVWDNKALWHSGLRFALMWWMALRSGFCAVESNCLTQNRENTSWKSSLSTTVGVWNVNVHCGIVISCTLTLRSILHAL